MLKWLAMSAWIGSWMVPNGKSKFKSEHLPVKMKRLLSIPLLVGVCLSVLPCALASLPPESKVRDAERPSCDGKQGKDQAVNSREQLP